MSDELNKHNHHGEEGCDCEDGCDCGCEHDEQTLVIKLDDDTEVECQVLGVFNVGEKEYIALLPIDDDAVIFFNYTEDGDEYQISGIESDDEFNLVSSTFDEIMNEMDDEDFEFDEYDEDDEDSE